MYSGLGVVANASHNRRGAVSAPRRLAIAKRAARGLVEPIVILFLLFNNVSSWRDTHEYISKRKFR